MTQLTIFLDDGGVINDNAVRGPQWQALIGEFLSPILGGDPAAWAAANEAIFEQIWGPAFKDYLDGLYGDDFNSWLRDYDLRWLQSMAAAVGVPTPVAEDARLRLVRETVTYVTERVRAAYPGAVDAIKWLSVRFRLCTASNEPSVDLDGYLRGMGVRHLFEDLYGPDLVGCVKNRPDYYLRAFARTGVEPDQALIVDDSPGNLAFAVEAGARTCLVAPAGTPPGGFDLVVQSLADLPPRLEKAGLWAPE